MTHIFHEKRDKTLILILAIILLILGLLAFKADTDHLKTAQEIAQKIATMLQEFASRDVVGII